jgi:hypothetical protein
MSRLGPLDSPLTDSGGKGLMGATVFNPLSNTPSLEASFLSSGLVIQPLISASRFLTVKGK